MKFNDSVYAEKIRKAKTPNIAAKLRRDRTQKLKPGWDRMRIEVMCTAVRAKFSQHEHLKILLLFTGNQEIIEHTYNDDFWGDGGNGKGQNWLGRILMGIRENLRTFPPISS